MEPKTFSPIDLAALAAKFGPILIQYGPAVYSLVESILNDLSKKQASFAAGAQGCPKDECACDCLDAQRDALVSALAHNLHLRERCGGCE